MMVKDKIHMLRKQKGMSTAQLGEAAGVNKGSISRYENGYVKVIPNDVLQRIADALEIPFENLIEGDPKYVHLSDTTQTNDLGLTYEEIQLLEWYRSLSPDAIEVIQKMWT